MQTHDLGRELDRTKSEAFLSKNAAFLGSLMCSLNFVWSEHEKTAATDGSTFWWNPDWFMSLPVKTRVTVLMHELWHVGRLHMVRCNGRDPEHWNEACDIRINNDLEKEGYSFLGVENCCKDHSYDANGIMSEEDIYDLIHGKNGHTYSTWGVPDDKGGDMRELTVTQQQALVNTVVHAVQQAKLSNQAGNLPGGIEEIVNQFLEPVVPWERMLSKFFTSLMDEDYSWRKPSRRSQEIYLPSRFTDDGRLEHLAYFLDVSGSISMDDIIRFNSELKYIQETMNPEKLTIIQFDVGIRVIKEYKKDDPFDGIEVIGRGGTSLVEVHDYIEKVKPTAAVIFSDLDCVPMKTLSQPIPVIWIVVGTRDPFIPFGTYLCIK